MKGMTVIVKTIARWVKVFIFLFALYITFTGHLTPGGGFAGGVILASSYMLVMLAFGREYTHKLLSSHVSSALDSLGALFFLSLAIMALGYGWPFFSNFLLILLPGEPFQLVSSGTIPLSNMAIALKVGASLFLVFLVLSVLRITTQEDGSKKMFQDEEEE